MRWGLAAVLAALLLPTAPASAKSFSLPEADVTARVARDGAVAVRESITFEYDGAFTGAYREIPLREGERIDRVSVSEGGERYAKGGSTAIGTEGRPSQFGARVVAGRMRIVWRYRAADERRTYTIRYRISGLARAYDDVVDVNLQVWGDTWRQGLGRLRATLAAPRPVTARSARVFGHPASVRGDTAFAGGRVALRAVDVPAEQFVELRLLLPRSFLTSTRRATVVAGPARERILAEERSDAAAFEASRSRIDDALDHLPRTLLILLALSCAPAVAILALVWTLLSSERRVGGYDREYEQEPPSDDPPALVAPLLRQSTRPEGAEFTATLFDLVRRGHLTATPTVTDKWSWGSLGRRSQPDLELSRKGAKASATQLEAPVAKILERALGNGPIALSGLAERIEGSRDANAASYASWQRRVAGEMKRRRWYDERAGTAMALAAFLLGVLAAALLAIGLIGLDPRTVTWTEVVQIALGVAALLNAAILLAARSSGRLRRRWTPAAALEAARWDAFRRYLRDFPRLQEAPPASVVLWERLLVYGIAFGLADRVLQAAKISAPKALEQDSSIYSPGYQTGGETFYSGPSVAGMSSGFTSALGAPSTGSGGGGGFSGGGGGGGGRGGAGNAHDPWATPAPQGGSGGAGGGFGGQGGSSGGGQSDPWGAPGVGSSDEPPF